MTDNGLLLAISGMLDVKLKPLEGQITRIEDRMTNIEGRVANIEGQMTTLKEQVDGIENRVLNIEDRTKKTEILLENDVVPRLQNIESCYTSTYERYVNGISQTEALKEDMGIVKRVVAEHSEKLQKIS
ncbi:hypothetical protein Ami103574_07210 [Aminipila butyrica]|uniref:Uncharacterized protein n=1 Tax=Aminipila butyrica TaxID=433296 RepID=A0A858BW41_9FIRM|nr:hypothetical protein [Aminipila butyrica]QIB69120.1 hypothetical protein Ami103574_07210 [Aminipila butyrica]